MSAHGLQRTIRTLVTTAAICGWSVPASANDMCTQLRQMIRDSDRTLETNPNRSQREQMLAARENYVRTYNAHCTGGGSSGGGSSGPSSAQRFTTFMGNLGYVLGGIRDLQRQSAFREANELNEQGKRDLQNGNDYMAIMRFQQAIELLNGIGDYANAALVQDNLRRAREVQALRQRNPVSGSSPGRGSTVTGEVQITSRPTDSGQVTITSRPAVQPVAPSDVPARAQPAQQPFASNPFAANPATASPRPPSAQADAGATAGAGTRDERTEAEIRRTCAGSSNPPACEQVERSHRARFGARDRERAEAAARREAEANAAQAELDRLNAEAERRRHAGSTVTPVPAQASRAVIPAQPFGQPQPDRRGDGYDECRRGAAAPNTVAGCWEQPATAAAAGPAGTEAGERTRERVPRRPGVRRHDNAGTSAAESSDPDASAGTADPDPEPRVTIAQAPADAGPPAGYKREVMMTEAQCRQWQGRYHTPQGSIVPVCDYPDRAQFTGLEKEAKDLAREAERQLRDGK